MSGSSSERVAHTAQSSFSGTDANGHTITVDGPVVDLAGLFFKASGQTLKWRRDTLDGFTIHVEVPQGVSEVQADLDFLLDAKANTIGAMLNHLAATDHYYALNSFDNMKWDSWADAEKKKWDIPMNLGEPARKAIKGNSLDYYLNILHESREKNLAEFRKRDDKWLATLVTEEDFSANNYAKWFHVAEHESNHDGQIKFLKSRVPGAKPTSE